MLLLHTCPWILQWMLLPTLLVRMPVLWTPLFTNARAPRMLPRAPRAHRPPCFLTRRRPRHLHRPRRLYPIHWAPYLQSCSRPRLRRERAAMLNVHKHDTPTFYASYIPRLYTITRPNPSVLPSRRTPRCVHAASACSCAARRVWTCAASYAKRWAMLPSAGYASWRSTHATSFGASGAVKPAIDTTRIGANPPANVHCSAWSVLMAIGALNTQVSVAAADVLGEPCVSPCTYQLHRPARLVTVVQRTLGLLRGPDRGSASVRPPTAHARRPAADFSSCGERHHVGGRAPGAAAAPFAHCLP